MISYGIDIQTPFMAIGIFLSVIIATAFRLFLKKHKLQAPFAAHKKV